MTEPPPEIPRLRLRELRLARGLTQSQLAERCGVTHVQVQRAETAQRGLPSSRVVQFARALGVHPGELFAPLPPPSRRARRATEIAEALPPEAYAKWLADGEWLLERATATDE